MITVFLLLSLLMSAPTTNAVTDDSKVAVRLVYSESFPKHCTKEDSTALFHLISKTIKETHERQERNLRADEVMDCSNECAWVGDGMCTVIKPWLAGPCNDWKNHRKLSSVTFGSFLEFQDEVIEDEIVLPGISDDGECTDTIVNVRVALQDQDVLSKSCARNVFGKPIEVQCFRGYV